MLELIVAKGIAGGNATDDSNTGKLPSPILSFSDASNDWANEAGSVAGWTEASLANRMDVCGRYLEKSRRKTPADNAITQKGLSRADIVGHFRAVHAGSLIGLHAIGVDSDGKCLSRWLAVDVDCHDSGDDRAANLKFALALYGLGNTLGFRVLLEDSDGQGSFHLWFLFDRSTPSEDVYRFGKYLIRDWARFGLAREPELFPKSPRIKPGECGNWLRLFGQHHTRRHYSRFWDGENWLEGVEAARHVVSIKGSPIPAEVLADSGEVKGKKLASDKRHANDVRMAEEAVQHLPPSFVSDYKQWVDVGMALSSLGPVGLTIWEAWSQSSDKFKPGECVRKWASFTPGDGLKLRSLIQWAKDTGWTPRLPKAREPKGQGPEKVKVTTTSGGGRWQDDAFTNYREEEVEQEEAKGDDEPKKKPRQSPLPIDDIDALMRIRTGDFPKRVGSTLFVESADRKPAELVSKDSLFAYLLTRYPHVDWVRKQGYVSEAQYYAYQALKAPRFDGIEVCPHFPPIPGIYYMHPEVGVGRDGGLLDRLVGLFNPMDDVDRELIRAAILTVFWGGQPGSRPAFLITGPENDPDQGRGLGKTKLVEILTEELVGGYLSVLPNETIEGFKTRLLSPEGRRIRAALFDNVKSFKLSHADLEAFITSQAVSGRQLYSGEGRRPNTVVVFITLNGASLSKDMAQRCVVVKLARPEFRADWESEVRGFIRDNRPGLLAEIRTTLESDPGALVPKSRWTAWERDVLSKCGLSTECQNVLAKRRGEVDEDDSERDDVAAFFREKIILYGRNPLTCHVSISSKLAAQWLSECLSKDFAANRASRYLGNLSISELTRSRGAGGRFWVWKGKDVQVSEHVDLQVDLEATNDGNDDAVTVPMPQPSQRKLPNIR